MLTLKQDQILGSRRFSNYFWAMILSGGGFAFLIAGLSSYLHYNLLPFLRSENINFIPQGVVMMFYGTLGLCLSLFLWLTIIWNVGSGYNQFDIENGTIKIFRLGFPGKNRSLLLTYKIQDVKSIKVFIKEGITPKRELYLKIKDNREIPLTRVGQPMSLFELENQGTELAKFLGVSLEGIDK